MTLPTDTPKLPKWPFLIGDAALLGLAWIIADQSRNPFTGTPLIAIVTCVALAALCGVVPFLSDYARRQDEALDDRQRGLDALSRTVAASAEQISIAANGLHEITELAQRNLKAADQLPQKLQEKIATFKAQLDSAGADDREELEKEVATLRAAEGERLESAADKMAKAIAELTRLEASAQKHLAASTAALEKATSALADMEKKLASATTQAEAGVKSPSSRARAESSADSSAKSESASSPSSETPAPAAEATAASTAEADAHLLAAILSGQGFDFKTETPAATETAEAPAAPPPPRKRAPRKPKGEGATQPPIATDAVEPSTTPAEAPVSEPAAAAAPVSTDVAEADASPPPETIEPKPEESAVSSDGATRLLVTAYIGIGNRLFIRGDGPGLSWDKGVPLQFVSIGKWRWETSDATGPVLFKLYKNDDTECTALGHRSLDSGQQQEVTATF
jgi:hypothetical protein